MRAWFDREVLGEHAILVAFLELSVKIDVLDRMSVVAESVEDLALDVFVEQYWWLHRLTRPVA